MGNLILIGIAILIIYGIIKLIIFIFPYVAIGFLIILGVGCGVGLLVGVFYGIRSYVISINNNISSRAFKVTMLIITYVFILMLLLYIIAAAYFLINYLILK